CWVAEECGGFHPGRNRGLGGGSGERCLPHHAPQVGIDHDLAVVTEVHRLQLVKLLAPLAHMANENFVAIEIIRRTEVNQDFRIRYRDFDIVGIGEINFAQILGITSPSGIEFANELVVNFHTGKASRRRLAGVHAYDHGKGIFLLVARGQIHQGADGVDEENAGADAGEGYRRAFLDFNLQPVGNESHDAGRFDPGDLLELSFALRQRNKEDVAANIATHDFHDLGVADVADAGDLDVVAGLNAKAPGVLAVVVDGADTDAACNDDG